MDIHLEETGQFGRKLSITVPVETVDEIFDDVYKEFAKSARIPGFRPGKAPRGIVVQHYGREIESEVRERLVGNSLSKAMQDHKVSPINTPQLRLGKLAAKDKFSYTAEFEVQPEIKLKKIKGLKVAKVEAKVSDTQVDTELEGVRKQATQLVPVLIRDTVEKGDVALIDYEGTMGGVPFPGGKAENTLIEIGGDGYLPGFSDGIEGAKVGMERNIYVDFPADYSAKDLAGKKASFLVRVKEIKRKELPTLDDDFAKDMGEESLAGLKERVRTALLARANRDADAEQRKKLLEVLVAANPFDLPQSMVNAHADRMIAGAAAQIQQMTGQRFDLAELDMDALRKDSLINAEFQVRAGLLLLQVAEDEKLDVSGEEIEAEVERMVAQAGDREQRVRSLFSDQEQRSRLGYRLLEDKAVKFLLSLAEFTGTETVSGEEDKK